MSAISSIRKEILGVSQAALAEIAGVTQPTVSRWERGELSPSLEEMERIRDYAQQRGLAWSDSWFFDPPATVQEAS